MEILKSANVFVEDIYCGILNQTDEGYSFEYDVEYIEKNKKSISLTMPLSNKLYESKILFPFFDGLIPEGWLLQKVVQKWKLDHKDRFSILLVSSKDSIGNVTVEERK
ncbi:MAG: HipA N-terminal domain-containing protein [bacterium]